MEIQSLSVCVPSTGCINNCKFCVSRQHTMDYPSIYTPYQYQNRNDANPEMVYDPITLVSGAQYSFETYYNKLSFARDNGCNTLMFTGCVEPQQNMEFIKYIAKTVNSRLSKPFRWMEIQTTGRRVNEDMIKDWANYGITTIALSINSFVDEENLSVMDRIDDKFNLQNLCKIIKENNLNLRMCLNLTKYFDRYGNKIRELLNTCKDYGADQVTFRVLYAEGETEQAKWVRENKSKNNFNFIVNTFIKQCSQQGEARFLRRLPHGINLYGFNGMSIAIDDDCMNTKKNDNIRYLVLRENGKLYTDWTDMASLLF